MNTTVSSAIGSATVVRHNKAHNGVEIVFPGKPSPEKLREVKSSGFRYHAPTRIWYKKLGAYSWAAAHRIAGIDPAPPMPTVNQPDRFDMAVEDQMAAQCGC